MSAIDGKSYSRNQTVTSLQEKIFAVILDVPTAMNLKEENDNGDSET